MHKQKQDDAKYDRVINCPTCEGYGRTYIDCITTYVDDDVKVRYRLASKKLYDTYPNGWEGSCDGYRMTIDCYYNMCPYCKGEGIAYAWYEKIPASKTECEQCQGSGQITREVKLEIGMGTKKFTCPKCKGSGSYQIPEKSVVHVKTKSGGVYSDNREELGCDKEGDFIGGNYSQRFIMEITKDNKELLEKSKPRTF